MKEYIARISYGKDSLKMLEVIKSRGLPLDRITTTDVWATDTVSARLPPMDAFVERMDQRIWDMYRIQVEHLCAMNKDGTKKTYEQMFYHVPVRKSGWYRQGTILGFPDLWNPWCQAALKRNAKPQSARNNYRIPSKHRVQLVSEAQTRARIDSRISGCRYSVVSKRSQIQSPDHKDSRHRYHLGAASSRSTMSRPLFGGAPDEAQRQKYHRISGNRSR